jgi:hypothetical protein
MSSSRENTTRRVDKERTAHRMNADAVESEDEQQEPIIVEKELGWFDKTLNKIHQQVSPYLLSAWLVVGATVNPETLQGAGQILGHVFVLLFVSWIVLFLTYYTRLLYLHGWYHWIKQTALDYFIWLWDEMKLIKDWYPFKAVVGLLTLVVIILCSEYLYYHFDFFDILHHFVDFITRCFYALLRIDEMIRLVHEWVNKAFLSWLVLPIRLALDFARKTVRESPWEGCIIIGSLLTVIPVIVIGIKSMSHAVHKARISVESAEQSLREFNNQHINDQQRRQ